MKHTLKNLEGWTLESRACGECKNIKHIANGPYICPKLLMAVTPTLYVMFEDRNGTCFEPKEVESSGNP